MRLSIREHGFTTLQLENLEVGESPSPICRTVDIKRS